MEQNGLYMSAFEPLTRIASTAFPYWLIAAALLSLLAGLTAKRVDQPLAFAVVAQFGATCAFIFMLLGLYVQLTGDRMSFAQLLPSSLIVAMIFSAAFLAIRPQRKAELGIQILGFGLGTVVFGFFLAFLLSVFPMLIALQWHLLKRI